MTLEAKACLGFQNKLPKELAIQIEMRAESMRQKHDIQIIEQFKQLIIKVWGDLFYNFTNSRMNYSDIRKITQQLHNIYDQTLLTKIITTTINGNMGETYEYRMTLVGKSFIEPEDDESFIKRVKSQSRCSGLAKRGAIKQIGICHRILNTDSIEINCDIKEYDISNISMELCKHEPSDFSNWLRSRINFLNILKRHIIK